MLDGGNLVQSAIVAAVSFAASVIGGVSGYGTGLLLPPILIPIIGPQAVVPVIGLSAVPTNLGRFTAYRANFDRRKALMVLALALPLTPVGAYAYTWLSGPAVAALIGAVKSAVFLRAGYLPFDMWVMALLIGICAIPGAFVGCKLTYRLTDTQHMLILDGIVILGGVLIVIEALTA
jgi:uncharacterized membrane protein YfcA